MQQLESYVSAAGLVLSDAVVAPGVTIDPDASHGAQELTTAPGRR
jgi:hypothetical protein